MSSIHPTCPNLDESPSLVLLSVLEPGATIIGPPSTTFALIAVAKQPPQRGHLSKSTEFVIISSDIMPKFTLLFPAFQEAGQEVLFCTTLHSKEPEDGLFLIATVAAGVYADSREFAPFSPPFNGQG